MLVVAFAHWRTGFILFCRHSDIICPNTPDPSAIFKEMVMNGNKEHKVRFLSINDKCVSSASTSTRDAVLFLFQTTAESLYTPVPEVVEPCKITLVSATSALQQNF